MRTFYKDYTPSREEKEIRKVKYFIVQKSGSWIVGPLYFYKDAEKFVVDNPVDGGWIIVPRVEDQSLLIKIKSWCENWRRRFCKKFIRIKVK